MNDERGMRVVRVLASSWARYEEFRRAMQPTLRRAHKPTRLQSSGQ